jgi:hypothetical protein
VLCSCAHLSDVSLGGGDDAFAGGKS